MKAKRNNNETNMYRDAFASAYKRIFCILVHTVVFLNPA